jgi:antibiotic biosynthesis monooxygenase (ABM) superfamily enzyme
VSNQRLPRYKLFLLTWLAIYPLITLILYFFAKPLNLLPLPIRTLVLTVVLVYLMTYWVMPMLMKLFHSWLYPKSR